MKRLKPLIRERVNYALESIFAYPLTIVEAPIGYGKTTAVREFLNAKRSPVLWLTLLPSEDTAAFFWERFAAEIGKIDEPAGARLKNLGFPSDAPQAANILSILGDLDYDKNTALVIDDFHLVRGMDISALLNQIVKEELSDLHIVVITRDTTNLDFAELAMKGLCNILSQQLLRFSEKEVQDYCTLMRFAPAEGETEKIVEYTGGWISLVYLTLLGMEHGIPPGRNNAIDVLVEKVLYDVHDESIKGFLRRLSVMDSFTAEQALFVTQEKRTEELLKKLRRENAFVSFDASVNIYKIHNVLLDFLRMRSMDVLECTALYRRVGEWYLNRKEYIRAYGYLCRAGETERILESLDGEYTENNDFTAFEGIFDLFAAAPRELLIKYPIAYLQYIALLLVGGDPDAAQDGAERLEELCQTYEETGDISQNRKNRVLGEACVARIFAVFNDAKAMIDCTNGALRLLDGNISRILKRESEFTFGSPHFLYSYYREPGKLKETVDVMVSGFPAFSKLANGCGTGCEYVTLAEYALETGDWQGAELNAYKAIYKAKTMDQISIVICATLTLIRLHLCQGKAAEALELLRQLRADVAKEANPVYHTTLEIVEGYVYGCLNRFDSIPKWLQTGDMSLAHFLYQGLGFNYIVYGKAVLLSKNYIQLEVLSETFLQYFSILSNQLGFLHNQIFEAAAKYRLYGMEAGCAALRKALDLAQEDHLVLPFAEYAPAVIDMMRQIAHGDTRNGYVKEVLQACEQYLGNLKSTPQSAASLTERELEVMILVAEGLKRNEIAGRLCVSEGTVKTHLENIYRKLEVNGKAAAIKKSQKLKII